MQDVRVELHFSVARSARRTCRRVNVDERPDGRHGISLLRSEAVQNPEPKPIDRSGAEEPVIVPEDGAGPEVRRVAVAHLLLEVFDLFFFLLIGAEHRLL
jgi:hypothetical protein